jgi:DUF4097 and DUF4098 domain-containing protein YvlB
VVVDVDFGVIDVSTNATSEVVVEVWRKISRKKKADEEAFLREHPVQFVQEGGTVTIRCRGETKRSWSWRGKQQNEAKYTLSVPAKFHAQLKTGGGGIDVVDLTGEVRAESGGGSLSFARLHGPLDGNTGGGSLEADNCHGPLKLRTGGGGVEVSRSSGSLDGKTGGGSVSVKGFQGAAQVSTGGGGVTIERVSGGVEASTGGGSISAVLPGQLADTVKLSTGGGGITVSVAGTAAFNLNAKTAGGSVTTDLPVAVVGRIEEGRLEGPVNGGGKSVQLRSGAGSIHLKKL